MSQLFSFPRLLPGSVFEQRFRVVRHLGDGGMGTVYEVVHIYLDKPMALKLVPLTAKAKELDVRDQFALEMKTLAALDHPSIVKIYDGGVTDNLVAYIAMALLPGKPLRHMLVHRAMNDFRICFTLGEVAGGLRALHQVPILHRDIKPENIFITDIGDTKLIDFGLARVRTASKYATKSPRVTGTLHYMPFEQLMNIPHDESIDIYAFGLVAWECFAGIHPLATASGTFNDRQTAMERITSRVPVPHLNTIRRDLPQALCDLIARCTSVEPEVRPKADALIDPFAEFTLIAKEEHDARAVTKELPPKPARAFVDAATEPQPAPVATPPLLGVTDPQLEPPTPSDPFAQTDVMRRPISEPPSAPAAPAGKALSPHVAAQVRAWLAVTVFDHELAKELQAFLDHPELTPKHLRALIEHFETTARSQAEQKRQVRAASAAASPTPPTAQHAAELNPVRAPSPPERAVPPAPRAALERPAAPASSSLSRDLSPDRLAEKRRWLSATRLDPREVPALTAFMATLPPEHRRDLNDHVLRLAAERFEREKEDEKRMKAAGARQREAKRIARSNRRITRIHFLLLGMLAGLLLIAAAVLIEERYPGTLPFFARRR